MWITRNKDGIYIINRNYAEGDLQQHTVVPEWLVTDICDMYNKSRPQFEKPLKIEIDKESLAGISDPIKFFWYGIGRYRRRFVVSLKWKFARMVILRRNKPSWFSTRCKGC